MATELKKVRETELILSKNLYLICAFVTFAVMVMTIMEFFSRGTFFPNHMDLFYLGILAIYALHKELVRWLSRRKIERQGEYFVYAWVILTAILYIINFISKDYYNYMPQGGPAGSLRDASIITIEVLGVFILTRSLKIVSLAIKEHKIKI